MRAVTDEMRDPATPASVEIRSESPEPITDSTLGILTLPPGGPAPRHRLVTVGDSLTQGFMSGAVYETRLAWPVLVARELGWERQFRIATYDGPGGGLPLNLEHLVRHLEARCGPEISWWEWPEALLSARAFMDRVEDFWERGDGSRVPAQEGICHNLAVYGWDLRDALARTADVCAAAIGRPRDALLAPLVENANDRAALRVLASARAPDGRALSPLEAAAALGDDGGIETLVVMLGANNALSSVVRLEVAWSTAPEYADLQAKAAFTVWDPEHFRAELGAVAAAVQRVKARHVVWATVPHVTVAPIARGLGGKVARGSRYFRWYARPWVDEAHFDPGRDPHLTGAEARAVDSAIDQYNRDLVEVVRTARRAGRDWYLLDLYGLLERLAFRRYVEDPAARPPWWTPYPLPGALAALSPPPDTRFFSAGRRGRTQGGLFSLDGVHPTTSGYGIVAQEVVNVMERAGVRFLDSTGAERHGPIRIGFASLLLEDALLTNPPRSIAGDLATLGKIDELIGVVTRWLPGRWPKPDLVPRAP